MQSKTEERIPSGTDSTGTSKFTISEMTYTSTFGMKTSAETTASVKVQPSSQLSFSTEAFLSGSKFSTRVSQQARSTSKLNGTQNTTTTELPSV